MNADIAAMFVAWMASGLLMALTTLGYLAGTLRRSTALGSVALFVLVTLAFIVTILAAPTTPAQHPQLPTL